MISKPASEGLKFRLTGLLLSRKFWVAVAAVVVAGLAVYALIAVPVGPTSFSFRISTSSCGCIQNASTNYTLPANAYVTMSFSSHYLGAPAEYILLVHNPAGVEIVYAVMQQGSIGGATNYANVSETFSTTGGGAFLFTIMGVEPPILPGLDAWVNGTYTAPILSL